MFACDDSRAEARWWELTRAERAFWEGFVEEGRDGVLVLEELVLVTEDERRESCGMLVNRLRILGLAFRQAGVDIGVTLVMRLARSLVLVEVLAAPRGLSLFVLFRPKTSLASSSFFLRSRSRCL
jgi:hypothetical protein